MADANAVKENAHAIRWTRAEECSTRISKRKTLKRKEEQLMWKLTIFQKKYQELEFEFDNLEKAVDFMDRASAHTVGDIEFHLTRRKE